MWGSDKHVAARNKHGSSAAQITCLFQNKQINIWRVPLRKLVNVYTFLKLLCLAKSSFASFKLIHRTLRFMISFSRAFIYYKTLHCCEIKSFLLILFKDGYSVGSVPRTSAAGTPPQWKKTFCLQFSKVFPIFLQVYLISTLLVDAQDVATCYNLV